MPCLVRSLPLSLCPSYPLTLLHTFPPTLHTPLPFFTPCLSPHTLSLPSRTPSLSGDCVDCRDLVLAQGALPALLQVSSVSAVCVVLSCASPSKLHFSPSFPLSLILLSPQYCSLLPPFHHSPTLSYPSPPPSLSLITHCIDLQRTLPPVYHP